MRRSDPHDALRKAALSVHPNRHGEIWLHTFRGGSAAEKELATYTAAIEAYAKAANLDIEAATEQIEAEWHQDVSPKRAKAFMKLLGILQPKDTPEQFVTLPEIVEYATVCPWLSEPIEAAAEIIKRVRDYLDSSPLED